MDAYFDRHDKDQNARNFGNDQDPSRGDMAWLNWGVDSGERWAEKTKAKMRGNPLYRKNFFGLFGASKPKYYVGETIQVVDPNYYDVHEFLSRVQLIPSYSLEDAIKRGRRMRSEYLRIRRGGNVLFIVSKNGSNISFIDYETLEPKSYAELKEEFKSLR